MPANKVLLDKLWRNLVSLCLRGKTLRRNAFSRHSQLQCAYMEDLHRYYQPPGQRKLRSADSLFIFPEAQLLADQAKHSITVGDFDVAHSKIDQGFEVLREAAHQRFLEQLRDHARQSIARRSA